MSKRAQNVRDGSQAVKLKLRRNNANARERNRMRGLNDALDKLRAAVPRVFSWTNDNAPNLKSTRAVQSRALIVPFFISLQMPRRRSCPKSKRCAWRATISPL